MAGIIASLLDPGQIVKAAYDDAHQAIRVENVANSLVPVPYDEIDLTYIVAGNGAGQIGTVMYKLASVIVATLTLTYDSSNRLITVVKS